MEYNYIIFNKKTLNSTHFFQCKISRERWKPWHTETGRRTEIKGF